MKKTTKFPLNDSRYTQPFSNGETTIIIDGMKVVFDKKIKATTVNLNYKKKPRANEKPW